MMKINTILSTSSTIRSIVSLRSSLLVLLALSVFHLSACITPVPLSYTYFKPHVDVGKLDQSMCNGQAGPKDVYVLDIANSVQLTARASRSNKSPPNSIDVLLKIVIPEGHVAQFTSRKFGFTDKIANRSYVHEYLNKVWGESIRATYPSSYFDYLSELKGDTVQYIYSNGVRIVLTEQMAKKYRNARRIYRSYTVELLFGGSFTRDFALRVPSIRIDGTEYKISEIRFTEKTGAFIMPLNC